MKCQKLPAVGTRPPPGSLNALPEKGKALNIWILRSEGWHSVANGLARVCEKLMKKDGAKMRKGMQSSSLVK